MLSPARAVVRDASGRPQRPSWTSRAATSSVRLPKLGREAMIGMLAGSEMMEFKKE